MRRLAVTTALVALAIALLLHAGRVNRELRPRRDAFAGGTPETVDRMPPAVAFVTVALGAVRGLVADALWLRAAQVKEEGRIFELVQLAEWITALEPRFTPAWSFHAWNLAYNVTTMQTEPEDRWRWVQHGIRMLRDRGLQWNPGDAQLYWELGWLFQHKLGDRLDPAHAYYKEQWAKEMERLIGGATPDYAALATLPSSRTDLLRMPGVSEAVRSLEAQAIDPFDLDALLDQPPPPDPSIPPSPAARSLLIAWLRRERMVQRYKLLPEVMREIDAASGPLDWRLPEAHAIYWATRGQPHAEGFAALQLARMRFQSLAAAFRRGRMFHTVDGRWIRSAHPDLMPRVRAAYLHAVESFPHERTVREAYRNWLSEAIDILTAFHRIEPARALFAELHQRYPSAATAGGFDAFVARRRLQQVETPNHRTATALIEDLYLQSLVWYALGDEDRFAGYDAQARMLWRHDRRRLPDPAHGQHRRIPELSELRRRAYDRALREVPPGPARHRLRALDPASPLAFSRAVVDDP